MIKLSIHLSFIVFILLPVNSISQSREFEILKNLELLDQIHEHLELYFVDEPETGKISKVAIDEMLKELDPYTIFYHESNMEDYRLMTTGEYGGIGALIRKIKGDTYIVEPYENHPAHKSGLKAGDKIISIEGASMKGKSSDEVSRALKGPRGTSIAVEVERANSDVKIIDVVRDQIKIPDVPYSGMIEDNIGYVRLSSFSHTAFQSVKSEFKELKEQGMEYAILDLRNNGGGLLFEAVRIVNLFVPKGNLVVYTKGRVKEENREYKTMEQPLFPEIPLVVLINEKSASASEIVAGSLQDLDRAVIIGQQSFGKGLVQRTYDLKYGSKLKLTISKYYTPSGRCVQRLEYYDKKTTEAVKEISDSMLTIFQTRNGRDVIDGRGIVPDVEIEIESLSRLTSLILMEDVIFEYVNTYVYKMDSISLPDSFHISEKEYEDFVSYVAAKKEFEYSSASELKLEELKEIAEEEGLLSEFKAEVLALEKGLKGDLIRDLNRYKSELAPILENEIISRYFYQRGKSIHSFSFDKSLLKAKEILNKNTEYNTILWN